MENVILIILLILALALIGLVLLQRSEGGGLGMGGGGGAGGGVVSGRSAATAMTKLTWIIGAAFMAMSLAMTVLSASNTAGSSVVDRVGTEAPAAEGGELTLPGAEDGGLLPPSADEGGLLPPPAD